MRDDNKNGLFDFDIDTNIMYKLESEKLKKVLNKKRKNIMEL